MSTARPKEKGLKIHLDPGSIFKGDITKESLFNTGNDTQ